MVKKVTIYLPDDTEKVIKIGDSLVKDYVVDLIQNQGATIVVRSSHVKNTDKKKILKVVEHVTFGLPFLIENYSNNKNPLMIKKVTKDNVATVFNALAEKVKSKK